MNSLGDPSEKVLASPGDPGSAAFEGHLPREHASKDSENKVPPASPSPGRDAANEEPELATEADLPSDGRDEVGEAMIRDLPRQS